MKITKLLSTDGMSAMVILITLFVLPFIAVPTYYAQIFPPQTVFISIGVIIAFLCFLALLIKKGDIIQSLHPFFLWIILLPSIFLLSALFSDVIWRGLTGYTYEVGTFGFVAVSFLLLFISSVVFRTKETMMYAYVVFFVSFIFVVALYVIDLLLRTGGITGVSIPTMAISMLGSWHDVGFYFAALVLLGVMTLEMVHLSRIHRYLMSMLVGVSLAVVVLVNAPMVWLLLSAVLTLFLLYIFLHNNTLEIEGVSQKKTPFVTIVVILLSLFFYFSGSYISHYAPAVYSDGDMRVSWQATGDLLVLTFADLSFLGSGPNRFVDGEFSYATGLIPTLAITTGIVGSIAWGLFLITYIYFGVVSLRKIVDGVLSRYFAVSSFLVSLFFWTTAIVYIPSALLFSLSFFFSGLFLASLYFNGVFNSKTVVLFASPLRNDISVPIIVFLLVASTTFGFSVIKKGVATYYFERGMRVFPESNGVEKFINTAIRIDENDVYYCALSTVHRRKISVLRSYVPVEGMLPGEYRNIRAAAVDAAYRAVELDPTNHHNWMCLGDAYASSLERSSVDLAEDAYQQALVYHPRKHLVYTSLARLHLSSGDIDRAWLDVQNALSMEPGYAEALVLQAEIAQKRGDNMIVW